MVENSQSTEIQDGHIQIRQKYLAPHSYIDKVEISLEQGTNSPCGEKLKQQGSQWLPSLLETAVIFSIEKLVILGGPKPSLEDCLGLTPLHYSRKARFMYYYAYCIAQPLLEYMLLQGPVASVSLLLYHHWTTLTDTVAWHPQQCAALPVTWKQATMWLSGFHPSCCWENSEPRPRRVALSPDSELMSHPAPEGNRPSALYADQSQCLALWT